MDAKSIGAEGENLATRCTGRCFRKAPLQAHFIDKFLHKPCYSTEDQFPKICHIVRMFLDQELTKAPRPAERKRGKIIYELTSGPLLHSDRHMSSLIL